MQWIFEEECESMNYIQYVRIRGPMSGFCKHSDVPFRVLKIRKTRDELSNYEMLGKTLYRGVVTTQFYLLLFTAICCTYRRSFKYVCHFESMFRKITPL